MLKTFEIPDNLAASSCFNSLSTGLMATSSTSHELSISVAAQLYNRFTIGVPARALHPSALCFNACSVCVLASLVLQSRAAVVLARRRILFLQLRPILVASPQKTAPMAVSTCSQPSASLDSCCKAAEDRSHGRLGMLRKNESSSRLANISEEAAVRASR